MSVEQLKINDEVIYPLMEVLGNKLKVVEIAPEFNIVKLDGGTGLFVWADVSEISPVRN